MPRKKKNEELRKWLNEMNLFVFQIRNDVVRTMYICNSKMNELDIKKHLADKYGEVDVCFCGRVTDIYITERKTHSSL